MLVLYARLRLTASLLLGLPFDVRALDRLVDARLDAHGRHRRAGAGAQDPLVGPTLDERTRRELQIRRTRAQAARAAKETPYYRDLFDRLALDPRALRSEDVARIPPTTKDDLRADPEAFVRPGARPAYRMLTTGTTGRPTSTAFSDREIRAYVALNALGLLTHGHVGPEDVVQVSTSSRALLGNTCAIGAYARVGATVYQTGVVAPEQALALLKEEHRLPGKKPRASVLQTYPSYLGELVELGLRSGYGADDFGLERVNLGGEVVTAGVKARCQRLFGPLAFDEGYGMTEPWPMGGTLCAEGHLHYEPSHGLVEVIDPDTGAPAGPGQAGTLVLTPFAPYRETTILLRYDTEDVVRTLPGPHACACTMSHLPATGPILGKLRLSARHDGGWTYPRQVLEALEGVDEVPLPARCGFWAVPGGLAVEVATPDGTERVRHKIGEALEAQGVPLRELILVEDRDQLRQPLPWRGDLRERSFRLRAPTPAPCAGRRG